VNLGFHGTALREKALLLFWRFTPSAADTNTARLPAKTHRTKHPLKNPNEIHQFTNLPINLQNKSCYYGNLKLEF